MVISALTATTVNFQTIDRLLRPRNKKHRLNTLTLVIISVGHTILHGNYGYHGRDRGRQGSASVEKHGNLPCVSDSVALYENDMPVVKGCVGDKLVTVLRDTGGAVIRKELVTEEQLTGNLNDAS